MILYEANELAKKDADVEDVVSVEDSDVVCEAIKHVEDVVSVENSDVVCGAIKHIEYAVAVEDAVAVGGLIDLRIVKIEKKRGRKQKIK